jgi:hypothetical protein
MKRDTDTIELFGPLLTEPSKIKREAVRRRKLFDEQPVSAAEIAAYEADGWQVDRKLKRSIRMTTRNHFRRYPALYADARHSSATEGRSREL